MEAMPQASYVTETQILHKVAGNPECRWDYTKHALKRMDPSDRDVSHADIEHALMKGHVILIETNKNDILWRVAGRDVDGRRIEVVVAVFEDEIRVKVVTVF